MLPTYLSDLAQTPFEAWKPYLLLVTAVSITNFSLVCAPPKSHSLFFLPAYGLTIWSLLSISPITSAYSPYYLDYCLGLTCIVNLIILPRILPRILLLESHNLQAPHAGVIERLTASSRIWNNPRRIPKVVARPNPQQHRTSHPRLVFLALSLAKIGTLLILHRHLISPFLTTPILESIQLSDLAPEKERFISRLVTSPNDITSFELALRLFLPANWIWTNYFCLETYHSILAIIFVCVLRIDEPEEWPPLFGNLLDAYSVRYFWSRFWHRITAREMTLVALPVSRKLMGCRPGSSMDKTVIAFMVFFLSGVAHAIVAWRTEEGHEARDVLFYVGNFAAAAVEVFVWRFAQRTGLVSKTKTTLWWKVLGIVWVYLWLMWIMPKWQFPKLRAGRLRQLEMEMAVMFGEWPAQ